MLRDDLGAPVPLRAPARRVVSLVPSLTEAIAASAPEVLVGATNWCTHPAGLDVARVRGTKNPDLAAIAALAPDLVVANKEESRELDVRRLRAKGIPVWVTDIETVPQAIALMRRLLSEALGLAEPAWLAEVARRWAGPPPPPTRAVTAAIWRDPWMVVGPQTYAADLLARLGCVDPLAGTAGGDRYPRVELAEIDRADVEVWLPDEPYPFAADDGPEAFSRARTRLVSGRLLTWYGPALLEAVDLLR